MWICLEYSLQMMIFMKENGDWKMGVWNLSGIQGHMHRCPLKWFISHVDVAGNWRYFPNDYILMKGNCNMNHQV
jgi:hypothetical protein